VKTLLTIVILLILSTHTLAQNVGEAAPDFSLTGLDGETYTLSELRGKVVYIFLFGANCPLCRQSGPSTESQIHQAYKKDEDFQAIGIDTWNLSSAAVQNFAAQTGISYPLLLQGSSVQTSFSTTYDRNLLIDKDGILRYKGTGPANSDLNNLKNLIDTYLETASSNEEELVPLQSSLKQNYPNPFNPSTVISFSISTSAQVRLEVSDILGRRVSVLENGLVPAGVHTREFSANQLQSGLYLYSLYVNGTLQQTRKMLLAK
jgi:peroxiredoxin